MQWEDPSIRTNFSEEDTQMGGVGIDSSLAAEIWIPDLYIYNLADYKSYSDSKQIKRLAILPTKELNQTKVPVELRIEAKATVICDFDLATYPMDHQVCEFRFGSRSSGATFMLYDPNRIYHNIVNYKAANFDCYLLPKFSLRFQPHLANRGSPT